MALTLTAPIRGGSVIPPGNITTLADQTATSAAWQPTYQCKWMYALISLKAFTAGTGTVPPIFIIEAADDSGFTTNVRRIAEIGLTVREIAHSVFLEGPCPDGAKAFFRVRVIFNGTDSGTYDAQLYGTP